MIKVMFINDFGENVVTKMCGVPSKGDLIPVFSNALSEVTKVLWMPLMIYPELKEKDIDVLITVKLK